MVGRITVLPPTGAARHNARVLILAMAASAATATSCAVPDAVGLIGGCVAPAVEQIQRGQATVAQYCDVEKAATIVAVPSRAGKEQLMVAGVPEWAARLMVRSDDVGDRWCQVLSTTEPRNGAPPGGRTMCAESSVGLPEVLVITGTKFTMTLVKDPHSQHIARLANVTRIQ
jgi:hypothetical protein